MMRRGCLPVIEDAVRDGERRLRNLLSILAQPEEGAWFWMCDAGELAGDLLDPERPNLQLQNWFSNINTAEELLYAEAGLGPE